MTRIITYHESIHASDLDIMARTIWGEARGEEDLGKLAVGHVIMNRVRQPRWWGRDIRTVCFKPYQFSAWNHNDPNRSLIWKASGPVFDLCYHIAGLVLLEEYPDNTYGATHYHAQSVYPSWAKSLVRTCVIGGHTFYRRR